MIELLTLILVIVTPFFIGTFILAEAGYKTIDFNITFRLRRCWFNVTQFTNDDRTKTAVVIFAPIVIIRLLFSKK